MVTVLLEHVLIVSAVGTATIPTLLQPALNTVAGLNPAANALSPKRAAVMLMLNTPILTTETTSVSSKSTTKTGEAATMVMLLAMFKLTSTVLSKSINGVATTGVPGPPAVTVAAATEPDCLPLNRLKYFNLQANNLCHIYSQILVHFLTIFILYFKEYGNYSV
jgi:hypothetical protein